MLKRIGEVVKICAQQGLRRGHRDNSKEDHTKDGNFMEILKGFADIDSIFQDHLQNGSRNAQMNFGKCKMKLLRA